ncbi:MAG: AraC family transcriptional regulator [Oscillospiraceae bacterium]|nr:AraC family transcriptional regulator [Oscillospiraceae bacterium]
MDWVKSFQHAVDYIEEHLAEPTDYERIAREMNVSSFYFQKIFSILCGFTVGEYIRNRRLTLAGSELVSTDEKIIDIALKYGYDTPEGFTRAFTRFHGTAPNAVRKNGAALRSFARLSVSISVKGGSSMDYKIMKKEAFTIIAKEQRFTKIEDVQGRSDIPAFWTECHNDGTVKYLSEHGKRDGVLGNSVVGMCMEDSTKVKDFPYLIGAEYAGGDVPDGYKTVEVPAAEWAVFGIGSMSPESIQQTWHNIFAEFFPSSPYKPAGNFDLEVYPTDSYKGEIWISVEKK